MVGIFKEMIGVITQRSTFCFILKLGLRVGTNVEASGPQYWHKLDIHFAVNED